MNKRSGVMRRRHEKWKAEYEEWVSSGQKQTAFCKLRGVLAGTFKSRMKRLREVGLIEPTGGRGGVKMVGLGDPVGFARVQVSAETSPEPDRQTEPYCEIRFRDAGRLVIEESAGMERFRELLGLVRRSVSVGG